MAKIGGHRSKERPAYFHASKHYLARHQSVLVVCVEEHVALRLALIAGLVVACAKAYSSEMMVFRDHCYLSPGELR